MDGYFKKCWICGGDAETGEHRFKRADIVRANGKGQYRGDDTLLHVSADSQTKIHGANSKSLKYPQSLCFDCNNNRSQQWDLTYDQLIDYVIENEEAILKNDTLNLVDAFKDSYNEQVLLLKKYFAKSFGCKVYSANLKVPEEIVKFINSPLEVKIDFKITFTINDDTLLFDKIDRDGFIGKSDLLSNTLNGSRYYYFNEHVSWFTTHMWFKCDVDPNFGSVLSKNKNSFYLPRLRRLSEEERNDVVGRLQKATYQTH